MKKVPKPSWQPHLVRIAHQEPSAAQVAAAAQQRGGLPVQIELTGLSDGPDYAQLDPGLAVEQAPAGAPFPPPPPAPGLGYGGFTPRQRAAFLAWILEPQAPAPIAFQQLYLANLEVRLLEPEPLPALARERLRELGGAPAWANHTGLARVLLLAYWLAQDGAGLARWLGQTALAADLLATALGLQAQLAAPLLPSQMPHLIDAWALQPAGVPNAVLTLRLDSLAEQLGQEPLVYVLAKLGDVASRPLPWRCQHRELRLSFPQPPLRPLLEPLLSAVLAYSTAQYANMDDGGEDPGVETTGATELDRAHLIVEFGHSRSEVFSYALRLAQKQPGFMQIMDETRHVIYRAPFRRNETRRFWALWELVQNWSSSRIYCDGRELEKWQVYPYSQYLR